MIGQFQTINLTGEPQSDTIGRMRDRRIVPELLREMRASTGFTQTALARASGVSLSLIKYAETGERQLSDRTAWAVAEALDCHPGQFSKPTGVTRRPMRAEDTGAAA